jgi:hypothetical protein
MEQLPADQRERLRQSIARHLARAIVKLQNELDAHD